MCKKKLETKKNNKKIRKPGKVVDLLIREVKFIKKKSCLKLIFGKNQFEGSVILQRRLCSECFHNIPCLFWAKKIKEKKKSPLQIDDMIPGRLRDKHIDTFKEQFISFFVYVTVKHILLLRTYFLFARVILFLLTQPPLPPHNLLSYFFTISIFS